MKLKEYINQVILNLIQDLQRLSLSLLNSLRGRSRIKYGMTALFNNGGFTLIELLVVVLIIGILAAVAVPQYQKAVVKSQYMSLKPLVRSIVEAQKRYYLENGTYAAKFEDLDISLPMPTRSFFQSNNDYYEYPWGRLIVDNSHAAGFIDTKFKIRYELYIDGKQQCMIDKNYEIGQKICKEDSGLSSPSSSYGTQDIYYWY